jgi:hypothetical protein
MTFFERYFAALDGPDPHSSLDLVAADVAFSIQWAAGDDRKSRQFTGGREDLRGFIDAGDMDGWAPHVLHGGTEGDVEVRPRRDAHGRRRADRDVPRGRAARRRRADGALHGRPVGGDRLRHGRAGRCRLTPGPSATG